MSQSGLHVAIIMDGNGRWAEAQGLPRLAGHHAGAGALRKVVESAPSFGIDVLTAFAFSSDNWKRPMSEVSGLMTLLSEYLASETPHLLESDVALSIIGRRDRLSQSLLESIDSAERTTRCGRRLVLQIAVDYSAREAILRALPTGGQRPLTVESFGSLLGQTKPVDLLIRTGGEQRLSDFLLWECAYAELFFTRCMWPDFDPVELRRAIANYWRRERRFGTVGQSSPFCNPTESSNEQRWLR